MSRFRYRCRGFISFRQPFTHDQAGTDDMGTRTDGYVDHQISADELAVPSDVIERLAPALRACRAVARYWRGQSLDYCDDLNAWTEDGSGIGLYGRSYLGPGGLEIDFGPRVATIGTAVRWRGFLTMPALRDVHRQAFISIGRALGGTRLMFLPDTAEAVWEAAENGSSLDECTRLIESLWGPTRGRLDQISQQVILDCEFCPPSVWYHEPL